jgi:hypothetical protein
MPELVIWIDTTDTFIEWDGLIGTMKEIAKYIVNLESWMLEWTPGNLIKIETDADTYFIKYDDIKTITIRIRELGGF